MTITGPAPQVVFAGIDTHKATHHAAVIDADGQPIADREFTTSRVGCQGLIDWLGQWCLERVGVEQTGTYGAGLTRLLAQAGYQVFDVNRPDPAIRATVGKSDPIDAAMAAEAVRTGRAGTIAKDRSGVIEAIRMLQAARASALKARTAALTQIGDLAVTIEPDLRARLGTSNRKIATTALGLRPDRTRLHDPTQAAKTALRSIATRIRDLDTEIRDLDAILGQLVTAAAPRLLARPQVGIHAAAQLLVTAGQRGCCTVM